MFVDGVNSASFSWTAKQKTENKQPVDATLSLSWLPRQPDDNTLSPPLAGGVSLKPALRYFKYQGGRSKLRDS